MADQNKKQSGGFNPIGLGMGIGLCFSVALGHRAEAKDKQDEASREEKE